MRWCETALTTDAQFAFAENRPFAVNFLPWRIRQLALLPIL